MLGVFFLDMLAPIARHVLSGKLGAEDGERGC